MDATGNTSGNTPNPELLARMKRDHRLSWHPKGGWCRKFPGDANRTYFGRVHPEEAIKRLAVEEDRRLRGEANEVAPANVALREAVNIFLAHIDREHASGHMSHSQRARYAAELDRLAGAKDVDSGRVIVGRARRLADFTGFDAPASLFAPLRRAAMSRGIIAAEKHVTMVRTFLDWCSTERRLMKSPFYGGEFKLPSVKEKRAAKKATIRERGVAYWQPQHVREIVAAAKEYDEDFYAQVLLVLNGGLGAKDLAMLEDAHVDWERRCIHTDRSKTLVPRVVPLWPETVEAMKASRAARVDPADPAFAGHFFLTPRGRPIVVEELEEGERMSTSRTDAIRNKFYVIINGRKTDTEATRRTRLAHLKRHRGGFYSLRSVFTTLSTGHGQDKNLEAIILGQQFDRPILEFYIRDDQRAKLRGIVDHVHDQIWPTCTDERSPTPLPAPSAAADA